MLKTTSGGVSIAYDPLQRITQYDAPASSRFLNDGIETAAEVSNPGNGVLRRWVRGDGPDELLVWYEGSGTATRRFLHADERGSVIAVTDASGNAIAINKYDEFGAPQITASSGRFLYTGQMWLPEVGAYHYKARAYAPHVGRFMQTDPIGYADGANLYAYVLDDPVNLFDPLGLRLCDVLVEGEPPSPTPCSTSPGPTASRGTFEGQPSLEQRDNGEAGNSAQCGLVAPMPPPPIGVRPIDVLKGVGTRALGILALILSVGGDTPRSKDQYVVRGGVTTPESLIRGSRSFNYNGTPLSGFSVIRPQECQ